MKNVLKNFIWIFNKCKFSIPILILLIGIGSLSSLMSVGNAMITKSLIDSAGSNDTYGIKKWTIVFSIFLFTRILLNSIQNIASTACNEKIKNKLQEEIYKHIIYSTWLSHSKYHSVEFLTRMTNDSVTITNLIVTTIPGIISLLVMLISSVIALLSISIKMAFVALSIFPFLILASKIYGRKLRAFYINIQKKETQYNRFIQESFNNILIVKSFCLENLRLNTLQALQNEKLNLSIRKSYLSCISNGLLSLSSLLGYFAVFVWGALTISSNTISATFGNLTAMFQLFSNIQSPIYSLASAFPQLVSASAAAERLIEVENLPLEISCCDEISDKKCLNRTPEIAATLNSNYNTNYSITFNHVYFSYVDDKPILKDINFKINPSEIIALIGPSGEGKTTLIRLLLSLITPDRGSILINKDILNVKHRELISYVPQGNTLFSGTILENLRFGNPSASNDDINHVLQMSCSYDFVNSLDEGLNTVIGEKGLGISEGQAQRLTIARALLRIRPILILDEATSSLDSDTEFKVLKHIKELGSKPICIIITHRPSALSICDRILKLEKGKITSAYTK